MQIGTLVRFAHEQNGGSVHRVVTIAADGLVELHDMGGFFGPHLFVIADDVGGIPCDDPPCTDCGGTGIAYQTERRCACAPTQAKIVTMQEWQPIETAPRDGSHILVCSGPHTDHWGFDQAPPKVVHYFPDDKEPGFYLSSGIVQDSYNDHPVSFTHWCPLGSGPRI